MNGWITLAIGLVLVTLCGWIWNTICTTKKPSHTIQTVGWVLVLAIFLLITFSDLYL